MALRSRDTIINAAMLRCGRDPGGGDSNLIAAVNANYDEIVRCAFEVGDGVFPFGRVTEVLTSRLEGVNGYDDQFVVPNYALHIAEVYFDDRSAADLQEPWEFDGAQRTILCNARGRVVTARMVKEGLEHTWSGPFAKGVQRALEAVIKDALEEPEEAAAKDSEADFKFMQASIKGAKNRSNRRVFKQGGGRLSRARFTRDYRGYDG